MMRLEVLCGTKAGAHATCATFPVRVGRASDNHLVLEDGGVWPAHFSIQRRRNDLFLHAGDNALTTLNGEPIRQSPLRNGDIIGLGSAKIRFGFSPVRQTSLAWRERATWAALAALLFGEVALAYGLW